MLRRIQYFQAVVESGNFQDAAAKCHVSQSAISQQVKKLEDEVGVPLLARHNRTFSLTAAGAHFYRRSLFLASLLEQLIAETRRIDAPLRPSLRLGYNRAYLGSELTQAVAEFSASHPQADISAVSGSHESLYLQMRDDALDLVVNDQRRVFSSEYNNLVLGYSALHIEVSSRSPLSRLESVDIRELEGQPCVLIAAKSEQDEERLYYDLSLGLRAEYQFSETLAEARLSVVTGRAFLPVDVITPASAEEEAVRRIPVLRNGEAIRKAYCAFWKKGSGTTLADAFAPVLRKCFPE